MLNTVQEQPNATLSMLSVNNPVLFSIQRLNAPELWKWWGLRTMWHKKMLSRFYFHPKPVTEEEGGTGELGAAESICHLGH